MTKSRESGSSAEITVIALKAILDEFKNELIHELRSDPSGSSLNQGNLIRPGEAAKRLGVSTRTLKRYRDDGKIPFIRRGIAVMYCENIIKDMLRGEKPNALMTVEQEPKKRGRPSGFQLSL